MAFDWPDRSGVDTATLKLLIAILLNAPREVEPHAVAGFWSTWSNSLYQLRLLDALLSLPADTFNFVSLPGQRIVTVDDVANASPTIKALAANVQGHTWNSLELFEVLVTLGDAESLEIRSCVREMLDKAVKISAELVHMGLLQVSVSAAYGATRAGEGAEDAVVQKPWNGTQKEYAAKLLGMFLAGHPNHQLVFMRIWQIDPTYLTHSFRDYYNESPLNITRILDVAQDLKVFLLPFSLGKLFQINSAEYPRFLMHCWMCVRSHLHWTSRLLHLVESTLTWTSGWRIISRTI
jgi:CCR4-NOT transcription complex subunit 1